MDQVKLALREGGEDCFRRLEMRGEGWTVDEDIAEENYDKFTEK